MVADGGADKSPQFFAWLCQDYKTTSTTAATCSLVVCEAIAEPKAVADSQLMTQYSFVCEAATKPKPITDKNGTKQDKTGQIGTNR